MLAQANANEKFINIDKLNNNFFLNLPNIFNKPLGSQWGLFILFFLIFSKQSLRCVVSNYGCLYFYGRKGYVKY